MTTAQVGRRGGGAKEVLYGLGRQQRRADAGRQKHGSNHRQTAAAAMTWSWGCYGVERSCRGW